MPSQIWIKATLKSKGFKLKDMADALGITAPRVTDILRGTREVQSDELAPLAELLGLSLASLLASLEAKAFTQVPDPGNQLPVLGYLSGDGHTAELTESETVKSVALPPDISSSKGLYCYIMGDNSMGHEIRQGDIIIAADPRIHFYPMVPGALFLIECGQGKLAPRQYIKGDSGESWLVPLPEHPNPKFTSWQFSMIPPSLNGEDNKHTSQTEMRMEIAAGETVYTRDIHSAVLWVHRRYIGQ